MKKIYTESDINIKIYRKRNKYETEENYVEKICHSNSQFS